jgi:signal transduction histidine kinase
MAMRRPLFRRLDKSEERLLTLLNAMTDAAIEIDADGLVRHYNGAALGLLNTHVDMAGEHIDQVMPLATEGRQKITLAKLIKDNPPSVMRNDLVTGNKEDGRINLELTLSPIRVSRRGKTHTDGYILVMRDITRQRSLDEERDEFISVASHELRTPVAIAEANLSTALLPGFTKLEPKVRAILGQAHDNMVFLGELIHDLTTLSRAQRDDLHPDFSLVDLNGLMARLWRDYTASATSRRIELKFKTPTEVISVVTSEEEVREIMQNFITNAIKYTEKGMVTLGVRHRANGRVELSVEDTGIGISASDQKRLFTKFYRSEDYRTRSTSGTGLGLYISKKLADRLDARIELESKLNHGTILRLLLPQRGLDE